MKHPYKITPDNNGDFNVNKFHQQNCVIDLLDDNQTVGSIEFEQDFVTITNNTNRQLNVNVEFISNKGLSIRSLGPVYISRRINCNMVDIEAKSILFEEDIYCAHQLSCNTKSSMMFQKKIRTNELSLESGNNIFCKGIIVCVKSNMQAINKIELYSSTESVHQSKLQAGKLIIHNKFLTGDLYCNINNRIINNGKFIVKGYGHFTVGKLKNNGKIKFYNRFEAKFKKLSQSATGSLFSPKGIKLNITEKAKILGKFIVDGDGYITLRECIISADPESLTEVNFDGAFIVNITNLNVHRNCSLMFKSTDDSPVQKIHISEELNIYQGAKVSATGSHLFGMDINNEGDFSFNREELIFYAFSQFGKLTVKDANVNSLSSFLQGIDKNTDDNSILYKSSDYNQPGCSTKFKNILANFVSVSLNHGVFSFLQGALSVKEDMNIGDATVKLFGSHSQPINIDIDRSLYASSNSKLLIRYVNAMLNTVGLYGSTTITHSQIDTNKLVGTGGYCYIKNSKINSKSKILLKNKCNLKKVDFHFQECEFENKLNAEDVVFHGDILKLCLFSGSINKARITTHLHFIIEGQNIDHSIIFENSNFSSNRISQNGYVILDKVNIQDLNGGDSKNRHLIQGKFTLKKTIFKTVSDIKICKNAFLTAIDNTIITSPYVLSYGNMDILLRSTLILKKLMLLNMSLNCNHSLIKIKETFQSSKAYICIHRRSFLSAGNVIWNGDVHMNEFSIANITNDVVVLKDSNFKMDTDASIKAKSMFLSGDGNFNYSKINLDMMIACSQVLFHNATKVTVTNDMEFAASSYSEMDKSNLKTGNLHFHGKTYAVDTDLDVEHYTQTHYGSKSTLAGCYLSSNKFYHGSDLETLLSNQSTKSDFFSNRPTVIVVNDKCTTSTFSNITGDSLLGNLNNLEHFGRINLLHDLALVGNHMSNYNRIRTEGNISLQFNSCIAHYGNISAENVSISTKVFFSPFSSIKANKSFQCMSLFDINLASVVKTDNQYRSSLFSLDLGLTIPTFNGGIASILTPQTILGAFTRVGKFFMPQMAHTFNFINTVPNLILAGKQLFNMLKNIDYDNIDKMNFHEWLPIGLQAFDFGASAINTLFATNSSINECKENLYHHLNYQKTKEILEKIGPIDRDYMAAKLQNGYTYQQIMRALHEGTELPDKPVNADIDTSTIPERRRPIPQSRISNRQRSNPSFSINGINFNSSSNLNKYNNIINKVVKLNVLGGAESCVKVYCQYKIHLMELETIKLKLSTLHVITGQQASVEQIQQNAEQIKIQTENQKKLLTLKTQLSSLESDIKIEKIKIISHISDCIHNLSEECSDQDYRVRRKIVKTELTAIRTIYDLVESDHDNILLEVENIINDYPPVLREQLTCFINDIQISKDFSLQKEMQRKILENTINRIEIDSASHLQKPRISNKCRT